MKDQLRQADGFLPEGNLDRDLKNVEMLPTHLPSPVPGDYRVIALNV